MSSGPPWYQEPSVSPLQMVPPTQEQLQQHHALALPQQQQQLSQQYITTMSRHQQVQQQQVQNRNTYYQQLEQMNTPYHHVQNGSIHSQQAAIQSSHQMDLNRQIGSQELQSHQQQLNEQLQSLLIYQQKKNQQQQVLQVQQPDRQHEETQARERNWQLQLQQYQSNIQQKVTKQTVLQPHRQHSQIIPPVAAPQLQSENILVINPLTKSVICSVKPSSTNDQNNLTPSNKVQENIPTHHNTQHRSKIGENVSRRQISQNQEIISNNTISSDHYMNKPIPSIPGPIIGSTATGTVPPHHLHLSQRRGSKHMDVSEYLADEIQQEQVANQQRNMISQMKSSPHWEQRDVISPADLLSNGSPPVTQNQFLFDSNTAFQHVLMQGETAQIKEISRRNSHKNPELMKLLTSPAREEISQNLQSNSLRASGSTSHMTNQDNLVLNTSHVTPVREEVQNSMPSRNIPNNYSTLQEYVNNKNLLISNEQNSPSEMINNVKSHITKNVIPCYVCNQTTSN
ncbi:unnamed protein product, partial [Meganyctiphanes norvegica]